MKFGKQIQKKQLEIPEYAASFVDYKALKKLIKELKNSPVAGAGALAGHGAATPTPQQALQANKAPFFFRLDRELDKVNAFYTVKESESKVRLRVLTDKQRSSRMRHPTISRISTQYITLEQGFRDFIKDLSKLQQFIEVNATAFSKILKKWDKTSKSHTKELYLSRAVEVQPCFNRDVISELSDQASTSLLDCAAWSEGEHTRYASSEVDVAAGAATPHLEQVEADGDLTDALHRGDIAALQGLLKPFDSLATAKDRLTRVFLGAVSRAPENSLMLLLSTGFVDLTYQDEINARNCLHKAAITGRQAFLRAALQAGVDSSSPDAYGRIPIHYASMNGHADLVGDLLTARPETVDVPDLDDFTPLIHAINHAQLECTETLLLYRAGVNPVKQDSHIPLCLACQYGSMPVVRLLLACRPTIMPDAEGLYPQHLVARFGTNPELLSLLREYGADLDQIDKLYQWTPLFHAASEGRVECLQVLIDSGARTDVLDEKGMSALYYATWEGHTSCMALLFSVMGRSMPVQADSVGSTTFEMDSRTAGTTGSSIEHIPDLSLPPPIIPTRRYGHNFLDSKCTVMIIFNEGGSRAVTFYDESNYPAARLTIAPRSSDLLARNLLLPVQEDCRCISFETEDLAAFAIDFEVYPTFGKKVIAKGSVPPEVFGLKSSSSGYHYMSLFDPRLRVVGQMYFKFQVIKPYLGIGLDITTFATYWKATSQLESKPSSFVTGSSLKGKYVRLPVQMTQDLVPIVYPYWTVQYTNLDLPLLHLSYNDFQTLGMSAVDRVKRDADIWQAVSADDMAAVHSIVSRSYSGLKDVLALLHPEVKVEIHVLYPSEYQEEALKLGPTHNINDAVDRLLGVVFEHARNLRQSRGSPLRSVAFSSYHGEFCTALNWKQPNYPVLLCNDLGADPPVSNDCTTTKPTPTSIKEAVRLATTNNFMGLMCRSRILATVPALIEAIKVAGLVLVSDSSSEPESSSIRKLATRKLHPGLADDVDGSVSANGVLFFKSALDV